MSFGKWPVRLGMAYYRTAAKILPKGLERVLDIEKTKRH